MAKILFALDFYYPLPHSNAICAHEIIKVLQQNGNTIDVVSFNRKYKYSEFQYENVNVHAVKPRLFEILIKYSEDNPKKIKGKIARSFALATHRLKKIILLPWYKVVSFLFLHRYYNKVKQLNNINQYDMIVSTYNPIEAVVSGAMLKKNNNLKFVLYMVDSLTNKFKSGILGKIEYITGRRWTRYLYDRADLILNFRSHQQHHEGSMFDKYRHKMEIVDYPLFVINKARKTNPLNNTDRINLVYAGALMEMRHPGYACECFVRLPDNVRVDFYSRGSCENLIEQYQSISSGKIVRKGFVEREIVIKSLEECDFLVSIANRNSEMLPSKIFEYISLLKPIIHFTKDENDACLKYLKEYPLCLIINEGEEDVEKSAEKIAEFIAENKNKTMNIDELSTNLFMSSPVYTASILEKLL